MASNCPYWKNKKCAGTNNDFYHDCSLDSREYEDCDVFKMIRIKSAGGSMLDMLVGTDLVGGTGKVIGGRRRLSDEELARITKRKKWWQFWK